MLKLLGRRTSSNVQKVAWLLDELQQPCEQQDLGGPWGGNREPAYLALNPNGTVPTLVTREGPVWESNTILRYLAASVEAGSQFYPAAGFARSQVERWMDWQLGVLTPAFRPLYIGLVRESRPLDALQAEHKAVASLFGLVEHELSGRDYLASNALSLADFAIGSMVHRWFHLGLAGSEDGALFRYYQRLLARPAFQRHVVAIEVA